MAVRCSKCGEKLLGAVNRCWKCGQAFAQRPEMDGRPPVRENMVGHYEQPVQAVVVAESPFANTAAEPTVQPMAAAQVAAPPAVVPYQPPRYGQPRRPTTADLVDARRNGVMAMGGTIASLTLGLFGILLAWFWPPAAIIAVLGLLMGIWGLYSPRRNWALIGMLLCCLGIGLGAYGGARSLSIYIQSQRPVVDYQAIQEP